MRVYEVLGKIGTATVSRRARDFHGTSAPFWHPLSGAPCCCENGFLGSDRKNCSVKRKKEGPFPDDISFFLFVDCFARNICEISGFLLITFVK